MRTLGLIGLLLFVHTVTLYAQKVQLSGYIQDAASGESLVGSTVYIKEIQEGVATNHYGFYSVAVPAGTYTVIYSYVGYTSVEAKVDLNASVVKNVALTGQNVMREVEVRSGRKDAHIKSAEMGTVTLSMARIKQLPVLFGEVDVLKTLQLLPGVQSGGDGSSGFYVRGGGPDQNLVLLDDATIYNTGHLFGFFSIFNSDAIKDVTLIKGGAPANYGGRLSSVVDVTMKEGNMREFHAQGGIGNIASRFTVEGPIKQDKGSFMIAGRRTYADVLARPFIAALKNSGYYFYDLNLKANYKLNAHNRLYLSGYTGLDKFQFESANGNFKATIPWGNTTASVRWNHQYTDKVFSNTSFIYNKYQFSSNFVQSGANGGNNSSFGVKIASGIEDYQLKQDVDIFATNKHRVKVGGIYTYHTFTPNQVSGNADTLVLNPNNALIKYAHELGGYVLDDIDISNKLKLNMGVRYSWFGQVGAYTKFYYNENDLITDSTHYAKGELVQAYGGWEPRCNLRYQISEASSVKASASKTYQFLHLVSNNGSTLPTDVWVPSTARVQPQIAYQYSLGYFRNFLDNKIETSVEVYYKDMNRQVQYKDGYTPNNLKDPEESYVFGRGRAYGAEFFINKTVGKFTGWVGYTLSYTYQKFDALNQGAWFPAKYDRRHDISVVGSYTYNKRWTFSSVFVYATGNAVTLPTAYYFIDNTLVQQFSRVNAYRTPAYHRLDISATYTRVPKRVHRWQGSWNFSIYNVYFHPNPYFLYNDIQGTVSSGITSSIKMVYIPPFIPSATYNFKF